MTQRIASALARYLSHKISAAGGSRGFFRLDGFDEDVYRELLEAFRGNEVESGGRAVVRTTRPLEGYPEYELEPGKSPTWYRNHLPPGYSLVLIFNGRTSDAQSLQNIFPVTESFLTSEGLTYLIHASFTKYQLPAEELQDLEHFLTRFRKILFEPQLRDLSSFFGDLNEALAGDAALDVRRAIAEHLPALGLFRCPDVAHVFNTPKADRLLLDNYRAARLGSELIDGAQRDRYLARLANATFEDDSPYRLSPREKREHLSKFLSEVLTDRTEIRRVLSVDWAEVSTVLYDKKKREGTQLQKLADSIGQQIDQLALTRSEISPALDDTLQDLAAGRDPDPERLLTVLDEYGDILPKVVVGKLRRLRGARSLRSTDFIEGLARLLVELLIDGRADGPQEIRPHVRVAAARAEHVPSEAREAFEALYGGVEGALPGVSFELSALRPVPGESRAETEPGESPDLGPPIKPVDISFDVSLRDAGGGILVAAELVWQYRPGGAASATLANLRSELTRVRPAEGADPERLAVPIYNSSPRNETVGVFDLSAPEATLGAWYREPGDLRQRLLDALGPRANQTVLDAAEGAIKRLEAAWAAFVCSANTQGLLAADLAEFLGSYEAMLVETGKLFQNAQLAHLGFRVLTQAWMIGIREFDEWAVMPLLHPLKLRWWHARVRRLDGLLAALLDSRRVAPIAEPKRFVASLGADLNSSGYSAVVALPNRGGQIHYLLPVQEFEGYELFRSLGQAAAAFGLDPELVTEQESAVEARTAAGELARVVRDYVETYPFVRDGLEVYLLGCRNGDLPGLLIEQLTRTLRHADLRLNIIVHSKNRGAPLYGRVSDWLREHPEYLTRPEQSYFPAVTLKVVEGTFEHLCEQVDDTDLVILADVLSEKGQKIRAYADTGVDLHDEDAFGSYAARQEPFEQGEMVREIRLTPPSMPSLERRFYQLQWAAEQHTPIRDAVAATFKLQASLFEWEAELAELHDRFNWVICYDTTVDRFLLEDAFPGDLKVIRYSVGLGAKRRHNLTVSSSRKSQDVVVRRLSANLDALLPGTPREFREQVALRLVEEAKEISGNIVLRAAGPGAYLNELIGLVTAKHLTERAYLAENPGALVGWVYLDDFAHWFDSKLPDLLFVAATKGDAGGLHLHIEVVEAKCVVEASVAAESKDAERQVTQGLNRLGRAWQPGKAHLDAQYWYDQLYGAFVGNLIVPPECAEVWEAFRNAVPDGAFEFELSGHAWVFCYNGSAGVAGESDTRPFGSVADDVKDADHLVHTFGRSGLRKALRDLVETRWALEAPDAVWAPQHDEISFDPRESVDELELEPVSRPEEVATLAGADLTGEASVAERVPALPVPTLAAAHDSTRSPTHEHATIPDAVKAKITELERAIRQFNIQVAPVDPAAAEIGPSIIRVKVRLRPGESIAKLQRKAEDLARELALPGTPFIGNVPGTNFVGIDLPNPAPSVVDLLPALEALPPETIGELPVVLGMTPDGQMIIEDLSEFPHLLVAGSTNSGKSVFLRSLVLCLLRQYKMSDIRLLIIDPKRTDFSFFNGLHCLVGGEVITDQEAARDHLLQLVHVEMTRRQQIMAGRSLRAKDFNSRFPAEALPPIVAVIDEYGQLVSIMGKRDRESFERDLMSLAAVARSVGIHLVLATQRPSAEVVTPTLRANLPASIAFKVASAVNSRIVIDQGGAENLLGRGDMLFRKPSGELLRIQAPYLGEEALSAYLDRIRTSSVESFEAPRS